MRTYWWGTDQNVSHVHETARTHLHRFAVEHMRPASAALALRASPESLFEAKSPFWEVLRGAYERRWHAALLPTGVGGPGLRGIDLALLFEELGWGSADMAVSIMMTGLPFAFVAATRKQDLIDEFVVPFGGDREAKHIGCWAVSEAEHGSDQFLLASKAINDLHFAGQLHARLDGEHYVIDGAKSAWVANAAIATHMVASLTLLSGKSGEDRALAFIPLDLPGITREPPMDMLGQRALGQTAVRFSEVRVPQRYLLVNPAEYQEELAKTLVFVHAAMGAIFTGVAQAAFETAKAHAQARRQGGKPLVQHQLVQKRLFEMYTRVEAARALSRAAMLYEEPTSPMLERAIAAKTFCTQAAFEVADSAVTLYGAQGLAREHLAARLLCDARAALAECGSNDVLALVAASRLMEVTPDSRE
jgi:alkylation response protein AidB-like acyl-CoA dehydrogenase